MSYTCEPHEIPAPDKYLTVVGYDSQAARWRARAISFPDTEGHGETAEAAVTALHEALCDGPLSQRDYPDFDALMFDFVTLKLLRFVYLARWWVDKGRRLFEEMPWDEDQPIQHCKDDELEELFAECQDWTLR